MQIVRLLPCVLLFAACGDNKDNNKPIDAPPNPDIDAPDNDIDAPDDIDAPVDADIDAPPGVAARIWVVGDFLADNSRQAGAFAADAALPFNTATPPPIVVPGGAAEIFDGTGTTAQVFDARGGKIAYVADQTVAGRFDLNVANADGTNPVVVVQGGTVGVEITSVALSPDGTKVAFTMDSVLLNGSFDLHVAATTAGATPVKISPDRPLVPPAGSVVANMDVFFQYEWSADSKFVSFSADLEEEGFDQVYVTDTTAANPTATVILARADIATQADGAQGVRGRILFDKDNNVYFRARVSTANNSQFTFFKSDTAGSKTTIVTPARGDASVSDTGAFGITPDGNTLVFSSDSPTLGTFNLFTQAIVNPQSPTNITNLTDIAGATLRAEFTTPLFFSPDSKKVAVAANFLSGTDNAFEPIVVNVDGTGSKRLAAITAASNSDTELMVWADNNTIFAQGDLVTNNETALFKLDANTVDQTLTPAVAVPTGGDLVNVFVVPQ
jgi:hypothetical protein